MNLPGRTPPDHPADGQEPVRRHPTNRQRLDEIFGDVLPDVTSDERRTDRASDEDRWYMENRPPHHG